MNRIILFAVFLFMASCQQANQDPQIESIDTSNPVMAGLEDILYNERGLNSSPKANLNDYFNIDFNKFLKTWDQKDFRLKFNDIYLF